MSALGPGPFTAVAMSGGLDSSVAAALLARSGERVVGLSMLLTDQSAKIRNGRCCGSLDLADARRVAQQVGIPHYTLRLDSEFERQVIDPFVADYAAGRTPSPCVRCNTFIKFDAFVERARRLGASRIATGHYARIVDGPEGLELHRAADEQKDQSYFLFELDQSQLAAACFPLGDMTKTQVRDEARRQGLVVAEKGESMEICFVDGAIEPFLEARLARDRRQRRERRARERQRRGSGRSLRPPARHRRPLLPLHRRAAPRARRRRRRSSLRARDPARRAARGGGCPRRAAPERTHRRACALDRAAARGRRRGDRPHPLAPRRSEEPDRVASRPPRHDRVRIGAGGCRARSGRRLL